MSGYVVYQERRVGKNKYWKTIEVEKGAEARTLHQICRIIGRNEVFTTREVANRLDLNFDVAKMRIRRLTRKGFLLVGFKSGKILPNESRNYYTTSRRTKDLLNEYGEITATPYYKYAMERYERKKPEILERTNREEITPVEHYEI